MVNHRLDSITIRVNDESGVIVFAIFRTWLGKAVVLSAMAEGGLVEEGDRFARGRGECDMRAGTMSHRIAGSKLDGELVSAAGESVTDGFLVRPDADVTKRRKGCVVEGGGTGEVFYSE